MCITGLVNWRSQDRTMCITMFFLITALDRWKGTAFTKRKIKAPKVYVIKVDENK